MPTPTSRSKILPARGSKANLDAALAAGNLLEGELCYAKDEDALYQVEAGVLVKAGGGLQPGDNVSLLANDAGYITSAEAPVDSVNGETGTVSLGIQEMDDFELNPVSPVFAYQTVTMFGGTDASKYNHPGEAYIRNGTTTLNQININFEDSNGDDSVLATKDAADTAHGSSTGVPIWTKQDDEAWVSRTCNTGDDGFGVVLSSVSPAVTNQATATFRITFNDPALGGAPLADGDVLQWNNVDQKFKPAQLATVATSGSYNDLDNKPTIPENTSDLVNDSGYITDPGVSQIVAGNNVSISPVGGTGVVTIEATLPVGGGTIDGGNFDTGVDTADGTAILDGGIFD